MLNGTAASVLAGSACSSPFVLQHFSRSLDQPLRNVGFTRSLGNGRPATRADAVDVVLDDADAAGVAGLGQPLEDLLGAVRVGIVRQGSGLAGCFCTNCQGLNQDSSPLVVRHPYSGLQPHSAAFQVIETAPTRVPSRRIDTHAQRPRNCGLAQHTIATQGRTHPCAGQRLARTVAEPHQRVVAIALPRHPDQAVRIGMLVMDGLGPACRGQVVDGGGRNQFGLGQLQPVQTVGVAGQHGKAFCSRRQTLIDLRN